MGLTTKISPVSKKPAASANTNREETPFEALASICSVLVVGLFILTFLAQNYVIPSGSMENTLLIGDHLVVDQITLSPPASWMPLIRYREPKRGEPRRIQSIRLGLLHAPQEIHHEVERSR